MKRSLLLSVITLILMLSTISYSQYFMDGDSSDWAADPIQIQGVDNVDGLFPEAVGAAVSDVVDVRHVRAAIVGNSIYFFMRFWGSPAWPNNVKTSEHEGVPVTRSRGYYHILLDLDNDVTTGWNTAHYESHYTAVGYLASQSVPDQLPIGAEAVMYWGAKYKYPAPHPDGGGVDKLEYESGDVSEYVGETDSGSMYTVAGSIINNPDSSKGMKWQGSLKIGGSDLASLDEDSLRSFWHGHGWGEDFLEMGFELTQQLEYWADKGQTYYQPGDIIGFNAFIETPADDWGCDMTSRGELVVPELTPRPSSITFDGDDSDWADQPLLIEDINSVDGLFPEAVGAVVSDFVDIKEVKAFVNTDEDAIYYFLRMWGGPAWPNNARDNEYEGVPITRSRGYYHILVDLDNDATTGWNTHHYESHYTPVGYLNSQGVAGSDAIGAEVMLEWGSTYYYSAPHPDSGGVQKIEYWAADYEEYNGETDSGSDYEMFNYPITDPDSSLGMMHDGLLVNNADNEDGIADWVAHAWGDDFIEIGQSLRTSRDYYMAKDGRTIIQPGDVIAICGMTETPADDWGVDMTARGEFVVTEGGATGVAGRGAAVADDFVLENNYPNPFNPQTSINYSIAKNAQVNITVYNTLGQKVRTLLDKTMTRGSHSVVWNGMNEAGNSVPSGIYFYTLTSGSTKITRSMALLK